VKLGFIGCDRTAAILARGLDEQVLFAGTDGARAAALAAALGGRVLSSYEAVAERADVVVLCHGPSEMARIAAAVAPHARILVSAVAGTSLGVVRDAYPDSAVYRIAVNSAAQIRRGVTVMAEGPAHAEDHFVRALLARIGAVITVDDTLVDTAVAVLSGVEADCSRVVHAHIRAGTGRAALDQLERFLAS